MSLRLYLDDCAYARLLVTLLRKAGHEVVTPFDIGTEGMSDEVHLRSAAEHGLVLVTKNPDDFARLHESNPNHSGILVIYQDNDPDRDMNYGDIVRAIGNLENAGASLQNSFHVLNAWRY